MPLKNSDWNFFSKQTKNENAKSQQKNRLTPGRNDPWHCWNIAHPANAQNNVVFDLFFLKKTLDHI